MDSTNQAVAVPASPILLVEDNPDIIDIVDYNLRKEGFEVKVSTDGEDGLKKASATCPSLILLDLMLPKMGGLEVCRKLRNEEKTRHVPIIMLTAKGEENDIVTGLQTGADDYVTKPFRPKELVARVKAALRRNQTRQTQPGDIVSIENLRIDKGRHEVTLDGNVLLLTLAEFRLLTALVASRGRVLTRDQLVEKIGGENVSIIDRNVDVHISSLRKKLGEFGKNIMTVRGVGYRFRD